MVKYYIEMGPVHNRSFINTPPPRPQGKIIEITESDWETLKTVHPSLWKLESGCIKAEGVKVRPTWHKDLLLCGIGFAAGLALAALVYLV